MAGKSDDVGGKIRSWLTDKLGNPLMSSTEKAAIAELEEADKKTEEDQKAKDDQQKQVIDQYESRRQ